MVHRLFWVAVGAAGGIAAYRKGSRMLSDARDRGMAGNVAAAVTGAQGAAVAASSLLAQARELRDLRTVGPRPAAATAPAPLEPLRPSASVLARRAGSGPGQPSSQQRVGA